MSVDKRIAEIESRIAAIEPWKNEVYVDGCRVCTEEGREGEFGIMELARGNHAQFDNRADADFIAAAPEDIRFLLDLVASLRAQLSTSEAANGMQMEKYRL